MDAGILEVQLIQSAKKTQITAFKSWEIVTEMNHPC